MIARLKLVEPCNENRQVDPSMPRRVPNADMRSREYLTPAEIEKLIKAAKDGRWALRDATLIMVAYRHGLRAKEACELEWEPSRVRPLGFPACPPRQEGQARRPPDPRR